MIQITNTLNKVSIGKKRPSSDDVKIISGRGYDLRQPIPVKYKIVRDRFLKSLENEWRPSEIAMGEDKQQWNSDVLTESERWLFKTNISYLTASDSLVPNNLVDSVIKHITANEMAQYFRRQIAEESIHLESYLFILESFGLDEQGQGEIFGLYEEIPELAKKLNWNLEFTNNLANTTAPQGSVEANRCLLEDLISYYVFEFLFFPLGFSQIFALARQGKLRNTAEQYAYIWRDECYSDDTEILTNSGWKLFSELSDNDKVAQFHDNMLIDFVKPNNIINHDIDEEIIHFSDGKSVDLNVTKNHRMVLQKKDNSILIKTANEVNTSDGLSFICVNNKEHYTVQTPLNDVKKEFVQYKGKVWCVSVDSGMIIVRRNGKAIVCGNCQHAENGLWLIRQIIKENPELWDNSMKERARAIVDEGVRLETDYAHASMPDGGIIGYSVRTYIEYAKFMGDRICENLGIKPNFKVHEHPSPWMSEFELNKEKNFFESRVTEYRTGTQLNWKVDPDDPVEFIKRLKT